MEKRLDQKIPLRNGARHVKDLIVRSDIASMFSHEVFPLWKPVNFVQALHFP